MNERIIRSATLVLGGVLIGASTTYLFTKKSLEKKYREQAEEEIQSVREHYKLMRKEAPYDDPKTALAAYTERIQELDYMVDNGVEAYEEEEAKYVNQNVFDAEVEIDVTLEPRSHEKPYLLTVQEFMADGDDYDKLTVTYFEEDDTLVDDRDEVVPDKSVVGEGTFERFGHGSGSPDIVYVRNEQIQTDFEIIRDKQSYHEMILGIEDWDETEVKTFRSRREMSDD